MKIKLTTLSFLFILALTTNSAAQTYINRLGNEPVYDVEVIVFGQMLAQPSQEQVKQAEVFLQNNAVEVDFIEADASLPKLKKLNHSSESSESTNLSDQTQVPLTDVSPEYQVLVWYLLANNLTGGVVERLAANPKYKPLIRKIWRQPVTPFNNPLYVKVNNRQTTIDSDEQIRKESNFRVSTSQQSFATDEVSVSSGKRLPSTVNIKDYEVHGQVALSQGRFTHLHIKFNYYRINDEGDVIIYASKQQKQIDLNQWQYFDHQQFGVLIKVTAVKAEELL